MANLDNVVTLDLADAVSKETVLYISGKDRGEAFRDSKGLMELDFEKITLKIIVPSQLTGISSSFTNGMLGSIVKAQGSVDKLLSKITFDAKASIIAEMTEALQRGARGRLILD